MIRIGRAITAVLAAAVAGTFLVPASAQATGDYGPDTCLQGWVWREAYTGDHVCVTPATRSQAAADNAQAANRRNPAGGPYGPDTCLQGWVWREARPSDHVCVTPATRGQTSADNGQAANRRASLNVWLTNWYPSPNCHGDTCTTTSDSDIPRIKVNGDHFNTGLVTVGVYRRSDNHPLWTTAIRVSEHSGHEGGSFVVNTNVIRCSGSTPLNAYVQAYDRGSSRRSSPIYVRTGCHIL